MLAYLNCHVYNLLVVVFTIVGGFVPSSNLAICLSLASG